MAYINFGLDKKLIYYYKKKSIFEGVNRNDQNNKALRMLYFYAVF